MQLKRYFAPDIRQAIRMVREDQGPDAVIISNRKVEGGVEIVTARDFDAESLADRPKAEAEDGSRRGAEARPACSGRPAPPPTDTGSAKRRTEAAFLEAIRSPKPVTVPSQRATPDSSPLPTPRTRFRPSRRTSAQSLGPGADPNATHSPETLTDLWQELRLMRRVLDAHFAATGWRDVYRTEPNRLDLLKRLAYSGFPKSLAINLINHAAPSEDFPAAWETCLEVLARQLPIDSEDLLTPGGIAALVGPTGVGKTTTIAKIAARFRLRHGPRKMALVTTDNYRIAAQEQLQVYARLLEVPVRAATNADELRRALFDLCDKQLVLIDTAGMGQRDARLAEQFAFFAECNFPIKSYLVLSATGHWRTLREAMQAFEGLRPSACILTKLDESSALGGALATIIERQLPLAFVCDGQQVPEDLHVADSALVLERCFDETSAARQAEETGLQLDTFEDWAAYANA